MKLLPFLLLCCLCYTCEKPAPPSWTQYPVASQIQELGELPKSLKESSGLVYWQQGLWTLNDGGNGPYLFQVGIHKKDKKKELKVKGVANVDWESLAADSSYFYIGDFGNNNGKRTDLTIHRIDKKDLTTKKEKVSTAGSIPFSYQDQEIGFLENRKHNFNCEAMVVGLDSIFLFTKNHGDQQTTLYSLSKKPAQQIAVPHEKFATDGLITGAAWLPKRHLLVLLGYNNNWEGHHPFVWIFSEFKGHDFFKGKAKRYNLPQVLQMEGIAHYQGNQFLLTNETEGGKKGRVFLLDITEALAMSNK